VILIKHNYVYIRLFPLNIVPTALTDLISQNDTNIIIIIIITEHLILRPKTQANSKARAFLLPIILALKQMSFQLFLEGRERN